MSLAPPADSTPDARVAPRSGRMSPAPLRVLHMRRVFSLVSESFINQPIERMIERGVDARMLALVRVHEGAEQIPTTWIVDGPQAITHSNRTRRFLSQLFRMSQPDMVVWPLVRPMMDSQIRAAAPDVVHAHFGPDGCLVSTITQRQDIPLVVTFYGYDVSRLIHRASSAWRARYATLFRRTTMIVAISEHIAERLIELGAPRDQLRVVPLGVRVEDFRFRPRTAHAGPIRCLHVGRLVPKKAPLRLIEAFDLARQRAGRELRLTMIGDGELRLACEREIERRGLKREIRLLGTVPHREIPDHFDRADIYTQHCVTSPDGDMEGQGVTFAEASACGLPVVSTLHNGIPEVVANGETGVLVAEHDVEGMADAIVTLASSPELREQYGRAGRARIEARYASARTVDGLLEVYDEARRRHRRRS